MKPFSLPRRTDGARPSEIAPQTRRIVIIGANGAGKTRFARRLAESLREQGGDDAVFEVSALRALYGRQGDSAIDRNYEERSRRSLIRGDIEGEFERLLALMVDEETRRLFAARFGVGAPLSGGQTSLEKLMELWQEIFPDNRMLLESGRMLFTGAGGDDSYESVRLSDGEKAVIYYLGCALTAPRNSVLLVDTPAMFLNRAVIPRVWNTIEEIHRDAPVVYVTHDLDFVSTRSSMASTVTVWVRRYDAAAHAWDYQVMPAGTEISDDVFTALLGARKPVMFIEGDGVNSIDSKLYPLVFRDYTVKSLGSCNRVIEATRTFNSLSGLHSLAAIGIVDRDRRTAREVGYLREHNIMVPEVAEIENILMLEEVIRAVARHHRRDGERAFGRVSRTLMKLFENEYRQQALLHTRHYVKMTAEYTVDRRFDSIESLERHVSGLVERINPRERYNQLCQEFRGYISAGDYASVLKVYNRKSMLTETNVASLTGCRQNDRKGYIRAVISIMEHGGRDADTIASAVRRCFGVENLKPQINEP